MQTLLPAYLKKGDVIGIVAPARSVELQKIEMAEKIFHSWGLQCKRGKHLTGKHFQFSGTVAERLGDLQEMLDDREIKAIICAGGGYGSVQLVSQLEFKNLLKNPKWIAGFSDVTVIHSAINIETGIPTIHSTMPVKFENLPDAAESIKTLKSALFGELNEYIVQPGDKSISGEVSGKLTGGNLSILYSLLGTAFDHDYNGNILFIEEVDEYLYHIDRMMYSFKLAGKFNKLKGMIIGSFSKLHDNENPFGKGYKEIILDMVGEYKFPVLFDFPAGHEELNKALYLGKVAELKVTGKSASLIFNN